MMVYVLIGSYPYDGGEILGIYLDNKEAEARCEELNDKVTEIQNRRPMPYPPGYTVVEVQTDEPINIYV